MKPLESIFSDTECGYLCVKPKAKNSNIKQFDIRVDANGVLKNFSTTEKDGQTNLYVLRNITNQTLADSLFQFSVPKGVELDDQT